VLPLTQAEVDEIEDASEFDVGYPMHMLFGLYNPNFKYRSRMTSKDVTNLKNATHLDTPPKLPFIPAKSLEEKIKGLDTSTPVVRVDGLRASIPADDSGRIQDLCILRVSAHISDIALYENTVFGKRDFARFFSMLPSLSTTYSTIRNNNSKVPKPIGAVDVGHQTGAEVRHAQSSPLIAPQILQSITCPQPQLIRYQ